VYQEGVVAFLVSVKSLFIKLGLLVILEPVSYAGILLPSGDVTLIDAYGEVIGTYHLSNL